MYKIITFICLSAITTATSQNLDKSSIDSLVTDIKMKLMMNYVIQEKAKIINDSLFSSKYYDSIPIDSLAEKINHDLYNLSHDKHLSIQSSPKIARQLESKNDIHQDQDAREKKENYGFEKMQILSENIGYLKLKYFANADKAKKQINKNISYFKNTQALILDLRGNSGGNGTMLQLLTGILLEENEQEILKITYKDGNNVSLKSSTTKVKNKYTKPLYVLINHKTFSAGEGLALVLQNRRRALLIGETTAGAGNISGPHPTKYGFVLTIPIGIILDPINGKGWEQIGVLPDVNINPDRALDKALEIIARYKNSNSSNDLILDSDGNSYKTAIMLDEKRWLTENLKSEIKNSCCFEANDSICAVYGRLYTWEAAQAGCKMLGVGWHLPSNDEWQTMVKQYGGVFNDSEDKGKSAYINLLTGGNSGFDALLGGSRNLDGTFARLEAHGLYWTNTETSPTESWFYNFGKGSFTLYHQSDMEKERAISVRCVKD